MVVKTGKGFADLFGNEGIPECKICGLDSTRTICAYGFLVIDVCNECNAAIETSGSLPLQNINVGMLHSVQPVRRA
jgi:hypothetical protein